MIRTAPVIAAAAALVLVGCADPYANNERPPGTTPAVQGEQPATPLPPQPGDAPSARRLPATAHDAVRLAAELSANWTARTAADRQARLAAMSSGQARRDALQAAARLPTDPQLAAGDASSAGTVEAIHLSPGRDRRRGLVVTRERLTVDGRTGESWRVTLVTVTGHPQGWAISSWQPQP